MPTTNVPISQPKANPAPTCSSIRQPSRASTHRNEPACSTWRSSCGAGPWCTTCTTTSRALAARSSTTLSISRGTPATTTPRFGTTRSGSNSRLSATTTAIDAISATLTYIRLIDINGDECSNRFVQRVIGDEMSDPKPPPWLKPMNKALMAMQNLGIVTGPVRVLTVPGRKSGEPRSTPATPFTLNDNLYVVGGYPRADWVLNARAAGA